MQPPSAERPNSRPFGGGGGGGHIRSYILRQGRGTAAQKRAWETLRGGYLVAPREAPPNWTAIFGRRAPLFAELGFGYGEATAALAGQNPQNNYVGFEVHTPGVGALLNALATAEAGNVKIVCADALRFFSPMFADGSLAGVNIFFPDPWPKTRHWKRRLIRPPFVEALAAKVAAGGVVHIATDWEDYAKWTEKIFAAAPDFSPAPPPSRPPSAFSRRADREGRPAIDLAYKRR